MAAETHRPRPERVRGRIDIVYFAKPQFSAGRLKTNEGRALRFAGPFFAREGEQVVLWGTWEDRSRFGRQFKVERIELDLPVDADGLASYLANHPRIRGIGPAKARRIADLFGARFDEVISGDPQAIADAVGLSPDNLETLCREWLHSREFNRALTWLSSFGLTHHQVSVLVESFGNGAVSILRADPYLILHAIRSLGFRRLDKIARQMGTPKDHPSRLRTGLLHCVQEAVDRGHTWVDHEELIRQANQLLVMDAEESDDLIELALQSLEHEGKLTCFHHEGRFLVAQPHLLEMEQQLHRLLSECRGQPPHFGLNPGLDDLMDFVAAELNPAQRRAARTALSNRASLITGPAGSGKTRTVGAIVAMCEMLELSVLLAAPTGKAARRLEELVGKEASTIHRLLGYDGETFACDAEHPLEAEVVIVDEVSVVDVRLAWQLFQAIDLERTVVVLVGDHNQLPPVGPGHLLRDLIRTQAIPTTVLDEVVRQAGVLNANSLAVLRGELRATAPGERGLPRPWYVVDEFQQAGEMVGFLQHLYPRLAQLGFDLTNDVQLLTPTRKGPLGVAELNVHLQALVQELCWGVEAPPVTAGRPALLLHDRVIQNRNNYSLDLMNGTLGTVTAVGPKPGELAVRFEDREIRYRADDSAQDDLSLAFAQTCHKCQGSEFRCVLVIVHKAHAHMLHRNWLYTAVTRAQQTTILIGDRWALRHAARERCQDRRRTFFPLLDCERQLTP